MKKELPREFEIISRIEPRFGSTTLARDWYESEALPGFAGATAMQLVNAGRADEVLDYIEAVDAGVHA